MLQYLIPQLLLVAFAQADCYTRNGAAATNTTIYGNGPELVSCGKGTNNCCLANEQCGTNLLCTGPRGMGRQYCADKTWLGCSSACLANLDAGVSIKECPTGSNLFCCGSCACQPGEVFFVDPLTGAVDTNVSKAVSAKPSYWTVDSAAILASASNSASSTRSLSITSSLPLTAISNTATAPVTSAAESSATASSSYSSSGLSPGAYAGIGVGVTAAVVAISLLTWFLIRERRKRKALEERSMQDQMSQAPLADVYQPFGSNKDGNLRDPAQTPPGYAYRAQEVDGTPRHELH